MRLSSVIQIAGSYYFSSYSSRRNKCGKVGKSLDIAEKVMFKVLWKEKGVLNR